MALLSFFSELGFAKIQPLIFNHYEVIWDKQLILLGKWFLNTTCPLSRGKQLLYSSLHKDRKFSLWYCSVGFSSGLSKLCLLEGWWWSLENFWLHCKGDQWLYFNCFQIEVQTYCFLSFKILMILWLCNKILKTLKCI